jgi:hypothetical protein
MCESDDVVYDIDEMVDRMKFYYSTRKQKNTTELIMYFSVERMATDYYLSYKNMLSAE